MSDPFLAEVIGQQAVREQLLRWWTSGRIPPGILLAGESGCGKRTIASAFARVLLAGDLDGNAAGGAGRRVAAGTHPDLEVIEPPAGQRSIGIDLIRGLKERFSLTIAEAGRRVAIIADAEHLTVEAANALLKLLEEPPARTHLLLTSRGRDAIPETLVSRCRVLVVPLLSEDETRAVLAARGIPPARVELLAALSEGRPGLAVARASAGEDESVIMPALHRLLGPASPALAVEEIMKLLRAGSPTLEGVRDRLRGVLSVAAHVLRAALRGSLGARHRAPLPDPELESAVGRRTARDLEAELLCILGAMADVERNVAPDLILLDLAHERASARAA